MRKRGTCINLGELATGCYTAKKRFSEIGHKDERCPLSDFGTESLEFSVVFVHCGDFCRLQSPSGGNVLPLACGFSCVLLDL